MELVDLQILNFGKFHNFTLSFQSGLNLIYGRNEAGKSTIHAFLRAMLFGLDQKSKKPWETNVYEKYKPWDSKDTYGGSLRFIHQNNTYRIDRDFLKSPSEFTITNETENCEVTAGKALMEQALCGLTEIAFDNTISIQQLKSATKDGMAVELKNYIHSMNTTKNMDLNASFAIDYLLKEKENLEKDLIIEAARSYAKRIHDYQRVEQELYNPEYANQLPDIRLKINELNETIVQREKLVSEILFKQNEIKTTLNRHHLVDEESVFAYREHSHEVYSLYYYCKEYLDRKFLPFLLPCNLFISLMLFALAIILNFSNMLPFFSQFNHQIVYTTTILIGILGIMTFAGFIDAWITKSNTKKLYTVAVNELETILASHIENKEVTDENLDDFFGKMKELALLCQSYKQLEVEQERLRDGISDLQNQLKEQEAKQEEQLLLQKQLGEKICDSIKIKEDIETMKNEVSHNEAIQKELDSIDLALETMIDLANSIRDSFGRHLNKEASNMVSGITAGAYSSMYIDEQLKIFMNTKKKLVPLEQVSSGTMDQLYLALRLSSAKLLQKETDNLPFIFDDSFVLYDDERLSQTLKWMSQTFTNQIILFTCHHREEDALNALELPFKKSNLIYF